MEQRREDRAVLRNPLVPLDGSQGDVCPQRAQRLHQVFPTVSSWCQWFLVARRWILTLWHRSEGSWCPSAQPSPHLAADWHHSPSAAELGALEEELCWMLIRQGNVVYFDTRLCFLASLSTSSDDICFIFPLDRTCDTLQRTKPGWFLKWALQRMHLCEKTTLAVWKGPSSAWRGIQYLQGVVPVTAGSRSWVQPSVLRGFPREIQ